MPSLSREPFIRRLPVPFHPLSACSDLVHDTHDSRRTTHDSQIKQKNRGRSRSLGSEGNGRQRTPIVEKKKINGLVQRITNRAEEAWYGDDQLAQKVVQAGDRDWFMPTALSGYLLKVRGLRGWVD